MQQLPDFLAHYRRLGFSHFTIVDNDSSDGSLEYLKAQKDVTLYHTTASFAKAGSGCLWRDALIEREGLNRWVCIVDADEYLVFPAILGKNVREVIAGLERDGKKRLFAPLLDLYHSGYDRTEYFDASPEISRTSSRGCEIWGGVRMRLANRDSQAYNGPVLSKYPLIYYDHETAYGEPHFPYPHARNDGNILGRLLHRKMTHWTSERIKTGIAEGQYWKRSTEYKSYRRWINQPLRAEASCVYRSPEDLVAAGLLENGTPARQSGLLARELLPIQTD